jgi:hypothetical protein
LLVKLIAPVGTVIVIFGTRYDRNVASVMSKVTLVVPPDVSWDNSRQGISSKYSSPSVNNPTSGNFYCRRARRMKRLSDALLSRIKQCYRTKKDLLRGPALFL